MESSEFSLDLSRRTVLKAGSVGAMLAMLEGLAWKPARPALAATELPDIQFDIGGFIQPATAVDGVQVQFGPVHTKFMFGNLKRLPTKAEQTAFAAALDTLESVYEFSPAGVMVFVSYGLGYFSRLPGGLTGGSLAGLHMPRLVFDTNRFAVEEAKAALTDSGQAGIVKRKFNIPPQVGGNDLLFTIRSDDLKITSEVATWLRGASSTLNGQTVAPPQLPVSWGLVRHMFSQRGLPRQMAAQDELYYADRINDQSPMWMGFADQQTTSIGPAAACTFAGNPSSRLTTAQSGDYFDNGAVQNFSHVILDLEAYYARTGEAGSAEDETYLERVQYMFRSNPPPSFGGGGDPFLNGGGPAFLPSTFNGTGDAALGAQGVNTPGSPTASVTWRRCSSRPGRPTARRCTSAWTGPASTRWTCRPSSTGPAGAATSRSSTSPPSYRRPTSSTRCGATRRRRTCRPSSLSTRSTTASSASSPRPGGRTSSARRGGTGPSRCWS